MICLMHMAVFPRMARAIARLCVLVSLVLLVVSAAQQAVPAEARDEVHKTLPFSDIGSIEVRNIKGNVRIAGWEKNEIKIDAVKRATSKEGLQQADVMVEKNGNRLCIYTRYANAAGSWSKVVEWFGHSTCGEGQHVPSVHVTVDYELFVPRSAVLGLVSVVTGDVKIKDIVAEVTAYSTNGKLVAQDIAGQVMLRTVNGQIEASLAKVAGTSSIASTNGSITVTVPPDSSAQVMARSLNGGIENDFGLPIQKRQGATGQYVEGKLGNGGSELRLRAINGSIKLRRTPAQTQAPTVNKKPAGRKQRKSASPRSSG